MIFLRRLIIKLQKHLAHYFQDFKHVSFWSPGIDDRHRSKGRINNEYRVSTGRLTTTNLLVLPTGFCMVHINTTKENKQISHTTEEHHKTTKRVSS
jgi:hypothetical protein